MASSYAQGAEEPAVTADIVRTTFLVKDFAPLFSLYQDIFGYTVVHNAPYAGSTFRKLFGVSPDSQVQFAILKSPTAQGHTLGLLSVGDELPTLRGSADYRPVIGEAILFSVTTNLDQVYERVLGAGQAVATIVAPPFDTKGGREMVIQDTNGIRVYVFEPESTK